MDKCDLYLDSLSDLVEVVNVGLIKMRSVVVVNDVGNVVVVSPDMHCLALIRTIGHSLNKFVERGVTIGNSDECIKMIKDSFIINHKEVLHILEKSKERQASLSVNLKPKALFREISKKVPVDISIRQVINGGDSYAVEYRVRDFVEERRALIEETASWLRKYLPSWIKVIPGKKVEK